MLVLSRKIGQKIEIEGGITVQVLEVKGDRVRVGITAPKKLTVHREEVQRLVDRQKEGK